jgi:hypothetical protein
MRKLATTAALLAAALGVSAGTANAAPTAPAPKAPVTATAATGVNYKTSVDDKTGATTINIDNGSMVNDHGIFKIKAVNGTVLAGTPLSFRVDQFLFPVEAKITGHTAVLKPVMDVQHATYKPVALPFEDQAPWKTPYDREVAAFTRLKDTVATGATIGTMTGLIGGGVLGCIAGAALGAVATGIVLTLFGAGPVAGCIVSAGVFSVVGALAGAILITAPVAIAALAQYFITTNQPFVAPPAAGPQKVVVVQDNTKKPK